MGILIGIFSGLLAAYLGTRIEIKEQDKAMLGLLYLLRRSALLAFLLIGLIAPVVEEIIFRYLGFSLVALFTPHIIWKLLITSFIFGFAHRQYPHNLLAGMFGLALGWVYHRYGLIQSIAAHATHNFIVVIHLLFYFNKVVGEPLLRMLAEKHPAQIVALYEDAVRETRR